MKDESLKPYYNYQFYNSIIREISQEWDTVCILPQHKLLINIEAKRGDKYQKLKEGAAQTKSHISIIKQLFRSQISSDWKFVSTVCMPFLQFNRNNRNEICSYCNFFVLDYCAMKDMKSWIGNLVANNNLNTYDDYKEDHEHLISAFIGYMSIKKASKLNKMIVDPIEYRAKTAEMLVGHESILTTENDTERKANLAEKQIEKQEKRVSDKEFAEEVKNILLNENQLCYMMNTDQLDAVMNTSPFIIIEGDYGTGKTYILKEKAKRCAEKFPRSKIAYVNLTTVNVVYPFIKDLAIVSVMDIASSIDLKDLNINVFSCRNLVDYYESSEKDGDISIFTLIERFLFQNKFEYVFIDEIPRFLPFIDDGVASIDSDEEGCPEDFTDDDISKQINFFQHCKSFCVTLKVPTFHQSKEAGQ